LNWFDFNFKKIAILGFIFLLPLLSINSSHNPRDPSWFNRPFSFITGKFEGGIFGFVDSVRDSTRLYLDLIGIKKKMADLEEQNRVLSAQLSSFEELKSENQRLSDLLQFKQKTKMLMTAARVISRDLLSDYATIQIDKGTSDGLVNGQAVISVEGVVGHIFKPEKHSSFVLLLTDRYSVVDGIVARSRARGLVEGKSRSECQLKHVEKSEDVQVGDIIVTSGLDNVFPKGFPVAKVTHVENKNYAVSLKIDVQPFVDPDRVEEVFVISDAQSVDLSPPITLGP
jgi:rod shape-determining protein MreC